MTYHEKTEAALDLFDQISDAVPEDALMTVVLHALAMCLAQGLMPLTPHERDHAMEEFHNCLDGLLRSHDAEDAEDAEAERQQ